MIKRSRRRILDLMKARDELVAKGYLHDTGHRRRNPETGEMDIVWKLTEVGVAYVEREVLRAARCPICDETADTCTCEKQCRG